MAPVAPLPFRGSRSVVRGNRAPADAWVRHGSVEATSFALVVTRDRVLLGRLRRATLEGDGLLTAEAVMEPGLSTVRADSQLEPPAERMRRQDLTSLPVTTPEGELLGSCT